MRYYLCICPLCERYNNKRSARTVTTKVPPATHHTLIDIDSPGFDAALDILLQEIPEPDAAYRKERLFARLQGELD